jgi:hypothetical protein
VGLAGDLEQLAFVASEEGNGDALVAVLPTEPAEGARLYLCAFEGDEGARTWVALDGEGRAVTTRSDVRAAASIAALCEVAEESALPGDLDELRAQLVALRIAENPPGIEEAEAAALALQHAIGAPPTLATPARLDEIGAAVRRLERALDPAVASPFAAAMQGAQDAVATLVDEIEGAYRLPLVS